MRQGRICQVKPQLPGANCPLLQSAQKPPALRNRRFASLVNDIQYCMQHNADYSTQSPGLACIRSKQANEAQTDQDPDRQQIRRAAGLALACALVMGPAQARTRDLFALPDDFNPESLAISDKGTFYRQLASGVRYASAAGTKPDRGLCVAGLQRPFQHTGPADRPGPQDALGLFWRYGLQHRAPAT